jgi:RNA polymerase sigma-70 factor (ECF subfamily)
MTEWKKMMMYTRPPMPGARQGQEVPDGALVGQAQAGDQRAFEVLVQRYSRPLARFIGSILKDDDQLAYVLQHVFLQLYLSLPTLLTTVPLNSWLFRVAYNRCLDELRRRRSRAEISFSSLAWDAGEEEYSPTEAMPDPGPLPEDIAEQCELSWLLQAALVSLPPERRLIVHLYFFKQLTFAEIGRLLNMPETTLKAYFYCSLLRLRRAIAEETLLAAVS